MILPHIRDFCREVKASAEDALVYCHICGNILPHLDSLARSGLDGIGPMDPLGGGTVHAARCIAQNRVALVGGVNMLAFLEKKPARVVSEAEECIRGGEGGGYILSSGCSLPPGATHGNLKAFVETAKGSFPREAWDIPS